MLLLPDGKPAVGRAMSDEKYGIDFSISLCG